MGGGVGRGVAEWGGGGELGGWVRVKGQGQRSARGATGSDRWCRSDTFLFKGVVVVRLQAAAGGTQAIWEKRR